MVLSAELPCDDECLRFRQELSRWPSNKPKAAIYILTKVSRNIRLTKLLQDFHTYFNKQFRYPVILFLDKDNNSSLALKAELKNYTVFYQTLSFELPSNKWKDTIPIVFYGASLGYRHMCRFHSKGIYKQPILTGLDYAWRLDDDSHILRAIPYDVFEFMRERHLSYGYIQQTSDAAGVVNYLWETTCRFETC